MSHNGRETEIKLPAADVAAARALLRRGGFRVSKRRVFERNVVFDTPAFALRSQGALLRLREARRSATLTFKGPAAAGKHKSREELETEVADARVVTAILQRLGFQPAFRYEKYRTEYRLPARGGIATLDETPIGVYRELEGSPTWIDRTARRLGFAESDYVTASYGRLYLEWCARRGMEPADMVFR